MKVSGGERGIRRHFSPPSPSKLLPFERVRELWNNAVVVEGLSSSRRRFVEVRGPKKSEANVIVCGLECGLGRSS